MKNWLDKYQSLPIQVKASIWFLACSFLQKGIAVISTPIFTRLMTAEEYGNYNVFNSWLTIITIFVSLRLYHGVYVQGLVKFEEDQKRYSSSMQGLHFSLCLIWTVLYLLLCDFWNALFSLTTVQMLAMLVMIWATGVFTFWVQEQRVNLNYKELVVVTILISLFKPIIEVIFVLLADDKVTARILGVTLIEVIGYSGFCFIQMRNGKQFFSPKYWVYALKFNVPLVPHYLSMTVLNSADRIMIKDMIGAAEAGIYSLSYSVSLVMILFNQALLQTVMPWMYKKIKTRRVEEIANIAYLSRGLIAIVNLFLIAFAPEVVAIFAPKSYYDAIWIIPPVAMSVFFMYAYNLFANFEFYFEKSRFIVTASIVGAILNIILNYIFIRAYGYYAAGYTTLLCYILFALGHYFFMVKICEQQLDNVVVYKKQILLKITFLFIAIGFMLLYFYTNNYLRYAVIILAIVYLIRNKSILMEIFQLLKRVRGEK